MTQAYFDNSATTVPCREAVAAVNEALTESWGNPSSLHRKGMSADSLLEESRTGVAAALGCSAQELTFTSGGTESNNLAVFGAAGAMRRRGRRVVSTCVEHPSVDEALTRLENDGFEVIRLPVDCYGRVNEKDIFRAVNSETVLVSMMLVNNEVGTIEPVEAVKRAVMAARSPALIHCDAVQAFGKLPFRPSTLGVDLMSISSHKIHGPKGVGALYIRKGVKINPHTFGGEQEGRLRPGTEPMPAIAGFGAAARALPDCETELRQTAMLRDYMLLRFDEIGGIALNSPRNALPFITSISIPGTKSEPMLNFLSARGIYVSSGSACSKGKKSRVLVKMGLDAARLDSPLRISFSRFTTTAEIDALVLGIQEGMQTIRRVK